MAVLFDTLTYHKGASLIRMMNAIASPSLYEIAMTEFLNKYQYAAVNQFQMFEVLDEVLSKVL